MQQFYTAQVKDGGEPVTIHFVRPVRKIMLNVITNYIGCSIGTEKNISKMLLLGYSHSGLLDFQSANTGKSVQDLTLWKHVGAGSSTVTISIIEYGSDGDNTYFE